MKKPENQLVVNTGDDVRTISEALGITNERRTEMQKTIKRICDEENASPEGNHVTVIKRVWDEFENPQECAFAMYILVHEETSVSIHSMFKLPESVEEEQVKS